MTGAAVLRATMGTALATVVGGGLAFAMAVLVARTMGPAAKGSYDMLISVGALGALVLGFALPIGVTFVVAQAPSTARRIPMSALLGSLLASLVFGLFLWVFSGQFVGLGVLPVGSPVEVIVPAALLAGVTVYLGLTRGSLVAMLQINTANLAESFGRIVAFVVAIAIVLLGASSPSAFVYALVGGLVVGSALQTVALRPEGSLDLGTTRAIAGYALPSYFSTVMQFLNYRLDIFIVAAFLGLAEVGLYATAVLLGQLVWLLARGAAMALFPVVVGDQLDTRVLSRVGQASRLATLSGLFGALLIAALGPFVIPALFGADFDRAVLPLWLLLPGIAAFCPVTIAGAYFLGVGKPRYNVIVSAASLVITVGADLLLIPAFGIAGAAIASSLSYVSALLVAAYFMRRATGLSLADLLLPRAGELTLLRARLRTLFMRHAAPRRS